MDHTENALRAVVSTLRTVVTPALDPGDALAQQQLGLSILYLEFLGSRLALLPERDRAEVEQGARVAEAVSAASGDPAPAAAAARARAVAALPGASRRELQHAAAVAAAHVTELIESDLPDEVRCAVEAAVVTHSAERVALDRAWFAPMGFDPDPGSIAPLDEIVASAGAVAAEQVEVGP